MCCGLFFFFESLKKGYLRLRRRSVPAAARRQSPQPPIEVSGVAGFCAGVVVAGGVVTGMVVCGVVCSVAGGCAGVGVCVPVTGVCAAVSGPAVGAGACSTFTGFAVKVSFAASLVSMTFICQRVMSLPVS